MAGGGGGGKLSPCYMCGLSAHPWSEPLYPTEALHSSYKHSPKVKKKKTPEESSWLSCLLVIWCNWEEHSNTVVSTDALPARPEHNSCARGSTIPTNPHHVCRHPHTCEHHAFDMQLMGPGDNKTLLYTSQKSSTKPVVRPGVRLSSWGALVQKYLLLFWFFFCFFFFL